MKLLIDTNFLLALASKADRYHARALDTMKKSRGIQRVIPETVLPELFYMCAVRINYDAALKMFYLIQSEEFLIEPLTPEDYQRMNEIFQKYRTSQFDYVDCAIMALSERLNITRVATFDRRDFSIFRPQHCTALELIPT